MGIGFAPTEIQPLVLRLSPTLQKMTDLEFFEFCQLNHDWRIEQASDGDIIIMPPTGGETGRRNFKLTGLFSAWIERDGGGIGFDSSTGFTLPNGARRSPDLAWVKRERWERLTATEREVFPPLCPDFVIELRSRSDPLSLLQEKMAEYVANGASLGWLIDPIERSVHIYQPGTPVQRLDAPDTISGEPLLSGFTLSLRQIWD